MIPTKQCDYCGETSEPIIPKFDVLLCLACVSNPKIGKCSQCDEIGELKKDIFKEMVCEVCYEENENEGYYDRQD